MYRILGSLFLLTLAATAADAQQVERNTGFAVHQLFVCPPEVMENIDQMEEVAAPILNQLRNEGLLREWFMLRHAWGDEWNVGWITIADSHREWLDYWAAFLDRIEAANPQAIEEGLGACTLHKDNMYGVRDSSLD